MPLEVVFNEADHTYRFPDGHVVGGITSILRAAGVMYEIESKCEVESNGFVDPTKGDRIHRAVHYDCEGDLDERTVNQEDMGYIEARRRACRELDFQIIKAEWPIGNLAYSYGTKVDAYGMWRGKPTVANWKTSDKLYRFYSIQSALEAMCFQPEHVERIAVQLKSNGDYRLSHYTSFTHFTIAKAAITLAQWRNHAEVSAAKDD